MVIKKSLLILLSLIISSLIVATPSHGDNPQTFYVFAAPGKDSTALWQRYQAQASVIKDYDALELSVVATSRSVLEQLKTRGEIEFFLPTKVDHPTKHSVQTFDWSEADGTQANIGVGPDWYWQRIHGDAFTQNGIDGSGVVVVILNSGIGNINHTLIKGKLERWYDWVNGKLEPYDEMVEDFLGHGLACAGEITRSLPNCRIHLHKIHRPPSGENFLEEILEAYNQICKDKQADPRPYVVSQSYGLETLKEFQGLGWKEADLIFDEAEKRLWQSNPDIYLVASAGNESTLPNNTGRPFRYPAASPRVISVGALKSDNEIALFSNLGASIWAPGSNILLAATMERFLDANRIGEKLYNNEALTLASGTSFSAPLVAADIAAILSFCRTNKIAYTREEIYRWICDWTDKETSVIRYKDYEIDLEGNRQQVVKKMVIPINQLDFENTVEGLKKLLVPSQN